MLNRSAEPQDSASVHNILVNLISKDSHIDVVQQICLKGLLKKKTTIGFQD